MANSARLAAGEPGLLSVCIVNWNTRELLAACLAYLQAHPYCGPCQVVVVDNGSQDGSAELVRSRFPQVRLIANETNLGYAAATNQALRASEGELLLLLNADTQVRPGALDALAACLQRHPRAGAVSAHLLHADDGSLQRSVRSFPAALPMLAEALGLARLFPGWPALARYRMRHWSHDTEIEVEQPTSSALLLRRRALQQVGLLDQGYPPGGFWSDVDLCFRLRHADWEIWYCPQAPVVHHLGASTGRLGREKFRQSHAGLVRFHRKHYPGGRHLARRLLMSLLSWLSLWPRWAAARPRSRPREGE